jgi:hypothetical protein
LGWVGSAKVMIALNNQGSDLGEVTQPQSKEEVHFTAHRPTKEGEC